MSIAGPVPSAKEILKAVNNLNNRKSRGPDGVIAEDLKELKEN